MYDQLLLILFVRNVALGLQRGARSGSYSCDFLKAFIHFLATGVPILVPSSSGGGMSHCRLHWSQPMARTIVLRICVLTNADCKDQLQVPFLGKSGTDAFCPPGFVVSPRFFRSCRRPLHVFWLPLKLSGASRQQLLPKNFGTVFASVYRRHHTISTFGPKRSGDTSPSSLAPLELCPQMVPQLRWSESCLIGAIFLFPMPGLAPTWPLFPQSGRLPRTLRLSSPAVCRSDRIPL